MNKKLVIIALVCIVLLIFAGCQKANPASDFEYKIYESEQYGKSVNIMKYIGTDKTVVIPEEIEGVRVTSLYIHSFSKTDIEKVVIADTVRTISSLAFHKCEKLEEVKFGKGVKLIHDNAFSDCVALKEVILPHGLEEIIHDAFSGCDSVEKVFIPSTIKSWYGGFSNMKSVKEIKFEEGLKATPTAGFNGSVLLKKVTFPESIETVSHHSFIDCTGLEKVVFEGDAPLIADYAFENCHPDMKVYYKKGTKGWDACPLREKYELIEY